MEFKEALKVLNIEKYHDRIIKSDPNGGLSHLQQYIDFAEYIIIKNKGNVNGFTIWFDETIKVAEINKSDIVLQYTIKIFIIYVEKNKEKMDNILKN